MKPDDHQRGLYGKYIVKRVDGSHRKGKKHEKCQYFVLDITHDTHALPALYAYSLACQKEFPQLASDLMKLIVEAINRSVE